jgi:hypothetical protein
MYGFLRPVLRDCRADLPVDSQETRKMHEQTIQILGDARNEMNWLLTEHLQKKDGEPNTLRIIDGRQGF